jgi:hypothetical protein
VLSGTSCSKHQSKPRRASSRARAVTYKRRGRPRGDGRTGYRRDRSIIHSVDGQRFNATQTSAIRISRIRRRCLCALTRGLRPGGSVTADADLQRTKHASEISRPDDRDVAFVSQMLRCRWMSARSNIQERVEGEGETLFPGCRTPIRSWFLRSSRRERHKNGNPSARLAARAWRSSFILLDPPTNLA